MAAPDLNPYQPSGTPASATTPRPRRWPLVLAVCACLYYGASAVTLPFLNVVWLGEIPVLAVFQIPKIFIKGVVHDLLLRAMHMLGMSHGSASPDYAATHGWAMLFMTAAPALLLVTVFACLPRDHTRTKLIAAVLLFATLDAIVTICFDYSSNLKIYNASFF